LLTYDHWLEVVFQNIKDPMTHAIIGAAIAAIVFLWSFRLEFGHEAGENSTSFDCFQGHSRGKRKPLIPASPLERIIRVGGQLESLAGERLANISLKQAYAFLPEPR
jgi:hypothetical protein